MGFGIRIFVAVLLALISLSVLSLHVALCFHYPSALFAVTLLLNPSLWLFIGLMSMFCTFVLSYRDKRRKLVPALCTKCRPKNESAFRFAPRSRCDCNRNYQLPSGKCSERSLLTCHYSSYSSVHTSTHLLTNDDSRAADMVSTTVHHGESGKLSETYDEDKRSLLSLDSSSKLIISDKRPKEDVQNFSCLVKNFRDSEIKGNTLVVLNKDGQTKNFYIHNNVLPQTHSKNSSEEAKSFCSPTAHCSRTVKPYILPSSTCTISAENTDAKSDSSSGCADNESDTSSFSLNHKIEPYKLGCQKYYRFMNAEKFLSTPYSPDIDSKYFVRNRCTCPRRKYTHTKNEIHFLGKSNKPIMRCTNSFKSNTPLHLFQAKQNPTEGKGKNQQIIDNNQSKIINNETQSLNIDKSDDISRETTIVRNNSETELISREPDTLTSIVSLLD